MKKIKFTEAQIVFALRQADTGVTVAAVCRKMGISEATYYNWKKKYGGLGVPELRRLKQLEEENQHFKQLVADLSLDKQMLQDVLKKSSEARVAWPRGSTPYRRLPHLGSPSLPSAPLTTRKLRLSATLVAATKHHLNTALVGALTPRVVLPL
jgi:putative transposase